MQLLLASFQRGSRGPSNCNFPDPISMNLHFSLQCLPLLLSGHLRTSSCWQFTLKQMVLTRDVFIFLQNSSKAAQAPSPWGASGK